MILTSYPNMSTMSSPVNSGSGEGVSGVAAGGGEGEGAGGVTVGPSETESRVSLVPLSWR